MNCKATISPIKAKLTIGNTIMTGKTIANKEKVIKAYHENFDCDFDIELYERDSDTKAAAVHTSLPLNVDIAYTDDDELQRIYAALITVVKHFDFGFTLDFSDIENLEEFVTTMGF